MTDVFAVKIKSPIDENIYQKLSLLMSEEKKNQIFKKYHRIDRERSFISFALAKTVISTKTGILKCDINFDANKYGKPYAIEIPNCHYNISHSGSWVVCAYDAKKPVGIDIEEIKDINYDIVYRFFSKEEVSTFIAKPAEYKLDHLFNLWTLKESFIKAEGKGLSIPLNSFSIKITNQNITLKTIEKIQNRYHFKQFDIEKGYKLSLCSGNATINPNINRIHVEDLLKQD